MGNFLNAIFRRDTPSADSEHSSTTQMESNPLDMQRYASSRQETMEGVTLHQGGACPKEKASELTIGEDSASYGRFCLTLESLLNRTNAETLATWFEYPRAIVDRISNSDNSSRVFVQFMDERGEISPSDISKLIEALEHKTVGLGGVAVKVKAAFGLHLPMVHLNSAKNDPPTQRINPSTVPKDPLTQRIDPPTSPMNHPTSVTNVPVEPYDEPREDASLVLQPSKFLSEHGQDAETLNIAAQNSNIFNNSTINYNFLPKNEMSHDKQPIPVGEIFLHVPK